MKTIVVSGALANKCRSGGESWVRLNWVLGLQRLGFRVYFFEEITADACVDSAGERRHFQDSMNAAYFRETVDRFGLRDRASLIYGGGKQFEGLSHTQILGIAETADLLLNISGHLHSELYFAPFRRKAFVDVDPGFTQMWWASGSGGARLGGHDVYFTIGENVGRPECDIPTCDIDWRPTRPPVVLSEWPVSPTIGSGCFTTVANWRGPFGPVKYGGQTFGLKVHEFRKFLELPGRSDQQFELALNIHPAESTDLEALRRNGWRVVDPVISAGSPDRFRDYVQKSRAEFSAAQGVYVHTHSGWFSDRTACYLASGKPALVQDTGFSRNYPVGDGLLTFSTLAEAAVCVKAVTEKYEQHSRAARCLAEEYFDSDKVLTRFLEDALD